jgi:hypothetical protein
LLQESSLLPPSYQPSLLLLCSPLLQLPSQLLLTLIDQALPGLLLLLLLLLLLAAAALTVSLFGACGQAAFGCCLLRQQALLQQ